MAKLEIDHYEYVSNILNKEEQFILNNYLQIIHVRGAGLQDHDQCNGETAGYADPLMEVILEKKRHLFEEVAGKPLLPTYSFYRCYNYLSDLKDHKDRPSCEISCTVNISGPDDYPIFMGDKAVNIKRGDGVLYHGPRINHSRKEFKGDWLAQVFLHYVYKDGENAKNIYDGKGWFGVDNNKI